MKYFLKLKKFDTRKLTVKFPLKSTGCRVLSKFKGTKFVSSFQSPQTQVAPSVHKDWLLVVCERRQRMIALTLTLG